MKNARHRPRHAGLRRLVGRWLVFTPRFAEAPQPRSGGPLRPLQRVLECHRCPPAANDLHPLYGAQELCDRRRCPFALTAGRNVASWICRHSQDEDRHHAQLRTIHLDIGKRRPEFRSPKYSASARRQTAPFSLTFFGSFTCTVVQCVVRCAVEGSAHAEQPGIWNSSPSGAARRDAGVRCRAESHDQRRPVRRPAVSSRGCAPAQPSQSDYRKPRKRR